MFRSLYHRVLIKRLHAVHIQNHRPDSLFLKELCRLHGRPCHLPAGNDGNVVFSFKFSPHRGLIHLERAVAFAVNILNRIASHPDVSGFFILQKAFNELCGLEPVAGKIDSHVGNG